MDHVDQTIQTYNKIAHDYELIYTPEQIAWKEYSMREFNSLLPGKTVLVAACGEGRHSRYLRDLGTEVTSFDLSDRMLEIARSNDPTGIYIKKDLREVSDLEATFDGIWACACLYHLTKTEFRRCMQDMRNMLHPEGVLFLNIKIGSGEKYIETPRDGYPGGEKAQEKLSGSRYYSFYSREELNPYFIGLSIVKEREDLLKEGQGAMEFWLRKSHIA